VPATPAAIRLPHTTLPGLAQMEIDAALLTWASASPGRLVFRTYDWDVPTLTLGRAEPFPLGWNEAALAASGIAVVRRPTGGDAVLHDGEVTFAVAASVPGPWAAGPRAFAELVATALAAAIGETGFLGSVVAPSDERTPPAKPGTNPCFARMAAGEVRVGAHKVAGIASRFARGGALSHASIPLSSGHRDVARFRDDAEAALAAIRDHARSLADLGDTPPDAAAFRARLLSALETTFGMVARAGSFEEVGIAVPHPARATAS
jgi:lipoate-protein ligase A